MFKTFNLFAFIRVNWRPFLLSCLVLNFSALSVQAAGPVLKSMEPRGGQRGKAFTLTLVGEQLTSGAELITTLPGSLSRLSSPTDVPESDSQLYFLVQLKPDAMVGLYPIRIRTDRGLSNILLFSIGTLPETAEEESLLKQPTDKTNNDSMARAQKLTLPITVNGTLDRPDQDYYRFNAKAGEKWVLRLKQGGLARRLTRRSKFLTRLARQSCQSMTVPGSESMLGRKSRSRNPASISSSSMMLSIAIRNKTSIV